MCYERQKIIVDALAALFKSEGLADYDVYISQDGGSNYTVVLPPEAAGINVHYVRHPVNMCPGQHHFLIKTFAFDVMKYESLIVVEEDNIVSVDAIKMLHQMLQQSEVDLQVGLVSSTDLDNSLLMDEAPFSSAVLKVAVELGHLWVFGMHASRYHAVRRDLRDYLNAILGKSYISKDQPPLRDDLLKLHKTKGFPTGIPLSQDSFLVRALERAGYSRRLTTMVRLFEPVGWSGLHFQLEPAVFYSIYGRGKYEGRITSPPVDVAGDQKMIESLRNDCLERLDQLYQQYLGRKVDDVTAKSTVQRLFTGKLNSVELMRNLLNSAEHQRRMKSLPGATLQPLAFGPPGQVAPLLTSLGKVLHRCVDAAEAAVAKAEAEALQGVEALYALPA
ncbi:hypothetical protein GPECTOR_58g558 [Gonium pectorale]|uniref:Uncharacterized protein n=1 Tax=Gonium pectorale TaxID=33097 RepID=A0A150G5E9_GONPE|nr:hypothetical protein GPECTOR_58g558 [Gonium pectorale]|eukprot:KXZ45109.1 hypothetical protein GPECTOR_58g558 [Gonium pectorale]